jgi:hypothetical protein
MFYLYLVLAFVGGVFSAIFAGTFFTFVKYYELNRKRTKRDH